MLVSRFGSANVKKIFEVRTKFGYFFKKINKYIKLVQANALSCFSLRAIIENDLL